MLTRSFLVIALVCASVLWSACDEEVSTLAGPTPTLDASFASIQREIFESTDSAGRTACTQCHTSLGRNPAGQLNLTHDVAYDQLVNAAVRGVGQAGALRVIPGDPSNSYLIHKLEGKSGITGNRMPNNGPPYLTLGQILILRRWIEIGAPRRAIFREAV